MQASRHMNNAFHLGGGCPVATTNGCVQALQSVVRGHRTAGHLCTCISFLVHPQFRVIRNNS